MVSLALVTGSRDADGDGGGIGSGSIIIQQGYGHGDGAAISISIILVILQGWHKHALVHKFLMCTQNAASNSSHILIKVVAFGKILSTCCSRLLLLLRLLTIEEGGHGGAMTQTAALVTERATLSHDRLHVAAITAIAAVSSSSSSSTCIRWNALGRSNGDDVFLFVFQSANAAGLVVMMSW